MERNKDKIYIALKAMSLKLDIRLKKGVTTEEISKELNIKRNAVSHLLNELYTEGKVVKINTRPVYFIDKEVYENNPELSSEKGFDQIETRGKDSNDVFNRLIGSQGSLKDHVKMCKSAVTYPVEGLPVLLLGNTGIGKSFMAQLIYEYAKSKKVIEESSPYVIFNCAEYANNPELLSANLFGYTKGAYTGAEKDKAGLLEEADGGYLFLDEVHRLPPEGQEKLFLFLDKGIFRRLGETKLWRSSKVRFIFATTEDPTLSLTSTFLRRIPLVVNLPPLSGRPIHEKLQMIYSFYQNEAKTIGIDIMVSKQVVEVLLKSNVSGSIGKLINTIKYSCALAYDLSLTNKSRMLRIHLHDLPDDVKEKIDFATGGSIASSMFVSKSEQKKYFQAEISLDSQIYHETERLLNGIQSFHGRGINESDFKKEIISDFNRILDRVIYKNIESYNESFFYSAARKVIQNILGVMENLYGIRCYGNASIVFAYLISMIQNDLLENLNEAHNFEELLIVTKNLYPKEYLIGKKMQELIEINLDIKMNALTLIYFTLYIKTFNHESINSKLTAIIISHGYSTASSISSVANRLLGQFVFEAFDMPIEMPSEEMMRKVSDYLKNINTSSGIIVLVDMGSLEEIYDSIAESINGDIGIINNITTQLAIEVGNRIMLGESVENIITEALECNVTRHKFIKLDKEKKQAIIITCMTGIGTAAKVRDLFAKCLMNSQIEIIAYDYNRLKGNGGRDEIFKNNDVKLIIGTSNPEIEEVPYLSLEDLILGKGYSLFKKALDSIVNIEDVEKANQAIIKLFSLQNVIKYITILDSDKIIDQVELIINNLEMRLGVRFNNDLKISLYIHTGCLIERLVMKEPIMSYKGLEEFAQCHRQFIEYVEKSFTVISDVYKVEIPTSEIGYIYDIIHAKLKNQIDI